VSYASDLRAVVRHREFRQLFGTRLTSQAADGLFGVALATYVFFSPERQTTAAAAAGAFAIVLLPYTVVGPFAGVLLDRWSRRQVLVWANVVRAAMVCVVAALAGAGVTGPALYVAALATLSVNRFILAALSAALPHVVDDDELVMANSVSTTSGSIAAICGGGVAFAMRALVGTGGDPAVMVLAAGVYLAASALAARMDRDLLGPDHDPARPDAREAARHVLRGLADGARHVWERAPARDALLAIGAHRFCYGIATIATLLLYRNYFNDPADTDAGLAGLGRVFAASGAGFLAAALVTPPLARRLGKPGWIVACAAASAAFGFGLSVPYDEPPLVAAAFLLGICAQGMKICVDTTVQESIEDAYRGRVFSFYDVLFNVSFVSAAAVAALAVPESGKSYPVLAAITVGYALTAVLYARAARRHPREHAPLEPGPARAAVPRA
jgi:MFS family permease